MAVVGRVTAGGQAPGEIILQERQADLDGKSAVILPGLHQARLDIVNMPSDRAGLWTARSGFANGADIDVRDRFGTKTDLSSGGTVIDRPAPTARIERAMRQQSGKPRQQIQIRGDVETPKYCSSGAKMA